MRRREFIAGIGGTAAWTFRATAQQPLPSLRHCQVGAYLTLCSGCVPQRPPRNWIRREPKCNSRVPLAGRLVRSATGRDGGHCPPPRRRHRHAQQYPHHDHSQSSDRDDFRSSSASAQTLSKLVLSRASPDRVAMSPASIIWPWRCRQSVWNSCMRWCLKPLAWLFL
jgi:hypothetical protein